MNNKQENTTELKELLKIIINNKNIILIITSLITIASIVWVSTRTPLYEIRALLEVGNYTLHNQETKENSKTLLDNSSQLVQKLNILFIDMKKDKKGNGARIKSINISKGSKEFIEIKSLAISNNLGKEEIKKIILYVQNKHLKILNDVKQQRETQIKNIDEKIKSIRNRDIPLLAKKIILQENLLIDFKKELVLISKNLKKIQNINYSLSALKLMEKRDLTNFIIEINTQILDMKDKKDILEIDTINTLKENKQILLSLMKPFNYKNTQIIGEAITNNYPIKPKKKLIVIVSFITGLILSLFIVFFKNLISTMKVEDSLN